MPRDTVVPAGTPDGSAGPALVSGVAPRTAPISVIGLAGSSLDELDGPSHQALDDADLVVGGRRHLALYEAWVSHRHEGGGAGSATRPATRPATEPITDDADDACRKIATAAANGARVCVLASGDPGFFGIVRALLRVVDRRSVDVRPAPSAISVAFARVGLPWDDATVVSAHGRPLADAVGAIRLARKAAVLTSPDSPPEAVGRALVAAHAAVDWVAVCSRLGHDDESVQEMDLTTLATGRFDPLSVVVLLGPGGRRIAGWGDGPGGKPLAWGLPEGAFGHRDGMVTKAEVRAIALGKLALPPTGVLWDVGAGSGSVAVECASLCPGLEVFAVEARSDDAQRISENAARHGVDVHVVVGIAPDACAGLPDPDRAFIGGGGMRALDATLERLRPDGRVVATFAAIDRATAAAERLGHLVQVHVDRARRLPDGGWRLAGENPVFVAWGPKDADVGDTGFDALTGNGRS